ncbi:hypothetical protein Tco_0488756 [Tanacetum coccineum]
MALIPTVWIVKTWRAATTVSSLDAGQGSGNIDKTPAMPHDSPLLRVHTLGSDEGRMQHNELMDLLIKKVKRLEDKLNKSRRKHRLVLSEEEDLDIEILAQEDPSKQGRKIAQIDDDEGITLVQMGAQTQGRHDHEMEADFEFTTTEDVSTTNVSVNIVGAEISIASPKVKTASVSVNDVVAEGLVYIRRSAAKRKDMEERKKIASIHEEASNFKPEEWDNTQARIEADEELAHRDDTVPKGVTRSLKRSAEEELSEESSKRQKI